MQSEATLQVWRKARQLGTTTAASPPRRHVLIIMVQHTLGCVRSHYTQVTMVSLEGFVITTLTHTDAHSMVFIYTYLVLGVYGTLKVGHLADTGVTNASTIPKMYDNRHVHVTRLRQVRDCMMTCSWQTVTVVSCRREDRVGSSDRHPLSIPGFKVSNLTNLPLSCY